MPDATQDIPTFWRTALERSDPAALAETLHDEFVPGAVGGDAGVTSRRGFLKLATLAAAMALVEGCTHPPKVASLPYVQAPENLLPGVPNYYATTLTHRGWGRGAVVTQHEGRPTKVEGNADHPSSLGGTDVWMQADVLRLYDPARVKDVRQGGTPTDWTRFEVWFGREMAKLPADGEGLYILSGASTSPTLDRLREAVVQRLPAARFHAWEPVNDDNAREGTAAAFGRRLRPVHQFDAADVIVSLDDDLFLGDPASVASARQWARRREPSAFSRDSRPMGKLFVAESTPSITGTMADQRLRVGPAKLLAVAEALAGGEGALSDQESKWVAAAKKALAGGRGVVTAGVAAPPRVHEIAARLNGTSGQAVRYLAPPAAEPAEGFLPSLASLTRGMKAGRVKLLLILDGDPAVTAPADFGFADAMKNVPASACLGLFSGPTAEACSWQLPMCHELESWGDCLAHDGTASLIQPLIAPLYSGRTAVELVSAALLREPLTDHELVRATWRDKLDETAWNESLRRGVIKDSAPAAVDVAPVAATVSPPATRPATDALTLLMRPDPALFDGRWGTNAWLLELPKPLTKVCWGCVALIAPATARRLGLEVSVGARQHVEMPVVTLKANGRSIRATVFPLPGQPADTVTLHLGGGARMPREALGDIPQRGDGFDDDVFANAYALRTSGGLWQTPVTLEKTGDTAMLACTQTHFMMDSRGRDLVKLLPANEASAGEAKGNNKKVPLTLYDPSEWDYSKPLVNKWAMVIDTNLCVGCNACVVACQAENNIPSVGPDQVRRGREMAWIHVVNYFAGDEDDPAGPVFQPTPCMHCEQAPCELVCPVNAAVHDWEGLNLQVYNRCVGTRYCSNNCPYKVRRFNFLQYQYPTQSRALQFNPDVSVRNRGVMEKCTYCLQRIAAARVEQSKTDAPLPDGTVVTACQGACPTRAIHFGNLNDKAADVTRVEARPDNYVLLRELDTRPRTSYLPRYVNATNAAEGGEA